MPTPHAAFTPSLAEPDCILVATDLTDLEFLLPHALAQACQTGSRVALVHAISPSFLVPTDPAAIPYVDRTKIVEDSLALMDATAKQLEAAGVVCDLVCIPSDPLNLIAHEIEVRRATRVIMGTQGRGKLGQLVLGSVAHQLVSKLDVPVFVVGPHARKPSHQAPARILHPVSLTGDYRESVALAVELAQTWKAELTLLYVFHGDIQEQADPGRRVEWARNALADLLPEDLCLSAPVHTAAAFGKISEQILKTAAETDADCIVMGVNAHAPFWSFQEDAVYQVIAGAACPVLSLRHGGKARAGAILPISGVSERSRRRLLQADLL